MKSLPEWLESYLPALRTPYRIAYDGVFRVVNDNGDVVFVADDLDSVYSHANEIAGRHNVVLDNSLNHPTLIEKGFTVWDVDSEDESRIVMITTPVEDSEGSRQGNERMYMSSSDTNLKNILVSEYQESISAEQSYLENPEDVVRAYNYIDLHPSMWTRVKESDDRFHWSTHSAVSNLELSIYHSDDSATGVIVEIEGGDHVAADDYRSTCLNLALTAYGETWEKAIIDFAGNLYRDYHIDGTMKDGAMGRASQAMIGLVPKDVLDDIDEWFEENDL